MASLKQPTVSFFVQQYVNAIEVYAQRTPLFRRGGTALSLGTANIDCGPILLWSKPAGEASAKQ